MRQSAGNGTVPFTAADEADLQVEGIEPGFEGLSDLTEIPEAVGALQEVVDGMRVTIGSDFAEVDFGGDEPPVPGTKGHDENLAEVLQEHELAGIADKVMEWVAADEEARKPWEDRIKEALPIMGIAPLADGDVAIEGGSNLTHPLIAEACVQFQARAMEELFPPEGPVKVITVGERTDETEDQADRVESYLNYRLTQEDEEYVEDKDKMTFILPAYGSTFSKLYRDPVSGKAVSRTCEGMSVLVPYNAASIDSAQRITHRFNMDANDVKRAMANGYYRDVPMGPAPPPQDDDAARELSDKADDRQAVVATEDDDRTLLECHCNLDVSADDALGVRFQLPYIVTVDKDSQKVLSLRRNWREGDRYYRRRLWFVHHKYLPGFGIYGFGLLHLIGVLAKAAGSALRALLDAAAAATFQGGWKTKDNRLAGEVKLKFGVWQDSNMSADELNKGFYTPPFREPSPALFQLLNLLISSGQRFASITEAMVGDLKQNMPVGTIISIIEQGSKVFSGIHKRLHNSHRREYRLLAEMIGEDMPMVYPYRVAGAEQEVMAKDFDERVDIFPVSDPNLYSSAQRVAISQAGLELAKQEPSLYDEDSRRHLHRSMLKALRTPDIDKILPPKRVKRLDPVTENQGFMTGKPARAFAEQDHQAHLAVHMQFVSGLGEEDAKSVMPVIAAHIAEHKAYLYRQHIEMVMGRQLPQPASLSEAEEMPVQLETAVARMVAMSGAAAGPAGPGQGAQQQGGAAAEAQAAQAAEMQAALQEQHGKILQGIQKLEDMKRDLERARDAVVREKAVVQMDRQKMADEAASQVRDISHARAELKTDNEAARVKIEGMLDRLDTVLERIRATGELVLKQIERAPKSADEQEGKDREAGMAEVRKALADALAIVRAPRQTNITRNAEGRAETLTTTVGPHSVTPTGPGGQ